MTARKALPSPERVASLRSCGSGPSGGVSQATPEAYMVMLYLTMNMWVAGTQQEKTLASAR